MTIEGVKVGPPQKVPQDLEAPLGASPNSQNREAQAKIKPNQRIGRWLEGEVRQSIVGPYSLVVKGGDKADINCKYAPTQLARYMGVKDCSLPPEGTRVLVYIPSNMPDGTGIVVATLPPSVQGMGGKNSSLKDGVEQFSQIVGQEGGVSYFNTNANRQITEDPKNDNKTLANAFRPFDMLPSEMYKVNDAGCFLGLLTLMASLGASDRAKIETFVFDDLVRITSGQWQHFHGLGETHIYNDEGHVSLEFAGSWFQPELFGSDDFGDVITYDKEGVKPDKSAFQFDEQLRTMKRRFQLYLGAIGDFAQLFLANPRDGSTETSKKESEHPGMLHMNVAGDGRLSVTSASGISFKRSDKIPTPKKLKEPWDPEGDQISSKESNIEDDIYKEKPDFEYTEGHPYARNMQHRDEAAFRKSQAYQRFDEMEKDYHTAEDDKLALPKDEYDHLKSETKFSEEENKQAGWDIGKDGSIHFWDAWGGEIYMRGGAIILGAPGGIFLESGDQIVAMGRDVVLKAKNSADITATDGDVRMAAKGNMHMYTKEKGILLETDSESSSHGFSEGTKGEKVGSKGITFKAANAAVFTWGQKIILEGTKEIALTVLDKTAGAIRAVASSINQICDRFIAASKEGNGGLTITNSLAALTGKTAVLAGSSSAAVFQGDQVFVPLSYADATNIYNVITDKITRPYYNRLYSSDAWLGTYNESEREPIKFTFRSPDEYKTETQIEVYTPSKADTSFKVYETLWQYYLRNGYEFIKGSTEEWKEDPVNETYPWPGEGARETAFNEFEGEENVDIDGKLNKPRKEINKNGKSKGFAKKSMDKYIIMQK